MAPSARAGKHSIKAYASNIEGASATQKVRSAEWTGEFAWNNANHPPSGSSPTSRCYWPCDVDYNKPWFEQRDGEWYCNLCSAWATEGHVKSDRHVNRSAYPQWYGFGGDATGGQSEAVPSMYTEPWFEEKQGDWYCNLCNAWATEGHVGSDRHKKRAMYPEEYGFPRSAAAASPSAAAAPAPVSSTGLPAGWERVWSEAHGCHYYHDTVSGDVTWDAPAGAVSVQPPGRPAASWGAAVASAAERCQPCAVVPYAAPVAYSSPEYDKPWFEQREGEWYCNLCGNWATEGHVTSAKHKKREDTPEWYGFSASAAAGGPAAAPAAAPGGAAPAAAPQLPQWEAHWSDEHGRHYYYNAVTKESTWDQPPGFDVTCVGPVVAVE